MFSKEVGVYKNVGMDQKGKHYIKIGTLIDATVSLLKQARQIKQLVALRNGRGGPSRHDFSIVHDKNIVCYWTQLF